MSVMDPILLSTLILIAAVLAWHFVQIRSLHLRLVALEKQYLSLVEDLEERLYTE